MDAPWRIELLGWLRATHPERIVSRFQTQKTGALLAYLAFFRDRSHPRQELIELLWPESPVEAGRNRLKVALASLRRQLEPPGVPPGSVVLADRVSAQLSPAACRADVTEFQAALRAAARAGSPAVRAQSLTAAIDLYRGELLPGHYEAWVLEERQRLAEAHLQALKQLAGLLQQTGDLPRALQYARRAVAVDPLREEEQQCLIRLLAAAGQPEAAWRQYRELERVLAEELGVPPATEIRDFVAALKPARHPTPPPDGEPAMATRAGAAESVLPHLPPHIGDRGNLPLQFTRFFGREDEIGRLCEAVGRRLSAVNQGRAAVTDSREPTADSPRLITLTGPGGSGKSRLALEVAARLHASFGGAVWFAPLVDLADPRLILDKLAETLRLSRSPETEPLHQVVAALSRQPALLVLDNFEHLLHDGTTFVQTLRVRVPTLTLLVTSRQRLDLPGEREFPVTPLPVPDVRNEERGTRNGDGRVVSHPSSLVPHPYSLLQCPSVRLFVDRAQAVRPDFQITPANAAAVGALCAQLEGLPLALELAAAHAGVLTPAQMLTRLAERFELLVSRQRGVDPRRRSLRAALDWSYHALSPELQPFFARLSVFRGGWSLSAAEAVCSDEGLKESALDHLERLRESSFTLPEEGGPEVRFRMLETVREYAAGQLAPEQRAAMERRHAAHYLSLAEAAEPQLQTALQGEWLERLQGEHDNLRAALAWSQTHGEAEMGLRLAGALRQFWRVRGYPTEGREWLAGLLALPAAAPRCAVRAKALNAAGKLAYEQGDPGAARAFYAESLAIGREVDNKPSIGSSLNDLGDIAHYEGNPAAAQALFEESLAIYRALGDRHGTAHSLSNLGDLALAQGDLEAALVLCEESLAIWRQLGHRAGRAAPLQALARIWATRGDYEAARLLAEESLAVGRELGNKPGIATSLNFLGDVTLWRGLHPEARALYTESLAISRAAGSQADIGWALSNLGDVAYHRGDLDEARSLYEDSRAIAREIHNQWGIGGLLTNLGRVAFREGKPQAGRALMEESLAIRRDLGDKRGIAECLECLAGVDAAEGQFVRAARLFGAAEALREGMGARRWPADRAEYERHISAVRDGLNETAFAAAWAAGSTLRLEQAVAEGLGEPAPPVGQIPRPGSGLLPVRCSPVEQGDLTDKEWERVARLLPASAGRRGRPYQEHRRVINGIFWVLRTRAQWRDLPVRYGSWHTCHDRYRRWRRQGLWERIAAAMD